MASGSTRGGEPRLVYLMGASGSGKDSIIGGVRQRLQQDSRLIIAHRYITRAWQSGGENHVELSRDEFIQRRALGLFALHWEANGQHYGIGCEVDAWLRAGRSVLVNGSRGHLEQARAHFRELLMPVLVTVDEALLESRLRARGRESEVQIAARLERARAYDRQVVGTICRLHNNADLADAVGRLMDLLSAREVVMTDA
ncbi:MAG: ribose 1,5-bisphosphokinase [Sedimenticola sp.]|nr:ribose 1,5-bisphosphokinase [Sedimenticola sp.]